MGRWSELSRPSSPIQMTDQSAARCGGPSETAIASRSPPRARTMQPDAVGRSDDARNRPKPVTAQVMGQRMARRRHGIGKDHS
jgi:hypothetical protein